MAKYKYSGKKTKLTPKGDHRKHPPKLLRHGKGWKWGIAWDNFINGRWEGAAASYPTVYPTKAEAMKHKPKW